MSTLPTPREYAAGIDRIRARIVKGLAPTAAAGKERECTKMQLRCAEREARELLAYAAASPFTRS